MDGPRSAESGAHLPHGHGLVVNLQEAMGIQLVKRVPDLLQVELAALAHVSPQLLDLAGQPVVPKCVQEPDRLLLKGQSTEGFQLVIRSRSWEHSRCSR